MRRLAPERPVLLPLSLAAALLVGACSATDSRVEADSGQRLDDVTATSDSSSTGSSSSGSSSGDSLDWSECGGPQIECARLEVPLDHSDPSLGTLSLAVTRRLADDEEHRIGSLLVNPGGPGVGTSFLAESAEFIYGQDLLDRFDIVAMDPRGVGESEPVVDCVDEYDPYFSPDPTPDDAAERQVLVDASAEFAAACADRVGTDLLQHVSTIDAARDFDLLRQALGETKISYFGFSYGSQLGATWLSMFPDTVRAAVLDSASAPDPSDDQAIEDAVALDRAFRSFLDDCAADTSCAFHSDGDPESAYNALLDQLDADPIVVDPDRTPVNEAVTVIATLAALYDSSSWPDLARALDAARDGDGSRLLSAYDDYLMRQPDGTYDNSFEGLLAINCIDDPGPLTQAASDELSARIAAAAPLLGRFELLPYVCADWPVRSEEQITIDGKGAGPVLVIGATGDPVTSIESSRAMADALEGGVLVTVEADQHIAYGVNACGDEAVEQYLLELVVPEDGTYCP